MKRLVTLIIAFGFTLVVYGTAVAHGGAHKTVMGTVHRLVETEVIVSTQEDGRVPIPLSPSTRYVTVRNKGGSREDLTEGMRVVIKLDVQGKRADEVRYRPEVAPTPDRGGGDE